MIKIPKRGSMLYGYEHTLMYGRYREDLGHYARTQAKNLKILRGKDEELMMKKGFRRYQRAWKRKIRAFLQVLWNHTFAKVGEDWIFLALLGIIMAVLSFAINVIVEQTATARRRLYHDVSSDLPYMKYIAWVSGPLVLVLFASGFVHVVAPQAVGSGIPEMKTILRGVVLREYLTLRTLVAKIVGLTFTLSSGLPLGREGPFVHISSIIATLLSRAVVSFKGIYEIESRVIEMLAAACAVGVAATFYTPIGGVLFSIEVTSVYFAVRNYWRGFFAACCGATVWRLLTVWIRGASISALFRTSFKSEFPFDPQELLVFAIIGVLCGFGGAGYVAFHRKIVQFNRNHKKWNQFLQTNRFIYPGLVTLLIVSCTFPPFLGKYMAINASTHLIIEQLFSNITWGNQAQDSEAQDIINHWTTSHTNIYFHLIFFIIMIWWTSALASTIPVPSGVFIPVFVIGAAFGRLVGEVMALLYPNGIGFAGRHLPIVPGGYAVVGAAAFSGAVTHTISTTVIVFELTGQMSHIVPVIMAVLIANAVAQSLRPSIYDSIIEIKKLPYLPAIMSTSSLAHRIMIDDIMTREVIFVWKDCCYKDIKNIIESYGSIETFPLVDSPKSMVLLGSVHRNELDFILQQQLCRERRLQEVKRRYSQQDSLKFTMPYVYGSENSSRSSKYDLTEPDEPSSRSASSGFGNQSSRFEIYPVNHQPQESSLTNESDNYRSTPPISANHSPKIPIKSILKPAAQFTSYSPNSVVTQDFKLRQAFENIFMKSLKLQDANNGKNDDTISSSEPSTPIIQRRVQLPRERVIDMSPEEQLAWEEDQLNQIIDLSSCHIDPAPFQLVERTSLLKVHSLFSMLQLSLAYVTSIGRLVGVVTLRDIRTAIEKMNNGSLLPRSLSLSPLNQRSNSKDGENFLSLRI
ncbi:chloride channel protein 2 isoform X2 [Brevipalpus obovatus]|uniref:chloride channel protein 2 isoform X2 n=1 Tax=Brevipalpus obovatus TaxID=246614 RepID=UPI003D9DBA4F